MSERIASKRGDIFEIDLSGSRAVYVVVGFYADLSIEALRVFPESTRVARKPTKVPRAAAMACTLPAHKLARVHDLTQSYRDDASVRVVHVSATGNAETIGAAIHGASSNIVTPRQIHCRVRPETLLFRCSASPATHNTAPHAIEERASIISVFIVHPPHRHRRSGLHRARRALSW